MIFIRPRTILLAGFAALLAVQCGAWQVSVPTMPASPFADTEVIRV